MSWKIAGLAKKASLKASLAGNLVLLCLSIMVTLVGLEAALRFSGYVPGYVSRYTNKKFYPTETLVVYDHFLTDGEGVFKANPSAEWTPEYRINAQGFRSIPFEACQNETAKILLLGDSFAWGASAEPITNAFADRLGQDGYCVLNTGIPGTDPRQYAFLAEKFVPLLQPDIVAVAFYMGNDFHAFRPMLPHKNLLHLTNVGFLQAFDEKGNYMTAEEAYEVYLKKSNVATQYAKTSEKTARALIGKWLTKSVVGTYLLVTVSKIRTVLSTTNLSQHNPPAVHLSYIERRRKIVKETKGYLMNIKKVAKQAGAKFLLFVIPVRPQDKNERNSLEANFLAFDGLEPLIPGNLTASDYVPNGHFNNAGHQKYAAFMSAAFRDALRKQRVQAQAR